MSRALIILRARAAVTMCGQPIEDAAVAISDGTISAVGKWKEVRSSNRGKVIDLGERLLLPGLINAHCHLDYTCLRGSIPPPQSFTAWVREINDRKSALRLEDYLTSVVDGLAEAASFGTTTVCNLEAFPELIAKVLPLPLRIWWFAEMLDVRQAADPAEVYSRIAQEVSSRRGGVGLAPHAPFTASAQLYRAAAAVAQRHGLPLTTHLAESREEMQVFRDGEGALFEFLRGIGRPMGDCGRGTPLQLLLEAGVLDERWIVAHLNELPPDDLRRLETAPRFHVAHCPRSHAYFGHEPFALTELRRLGFNICLGTDSLASNADLSLFAEMRQLSKVEPWLAPKELLGMATINPAKALGQHGTLGRIAPGYAADLIAIPAQRSGNALLEEVLEFHGVVPWMMVAGEKALAG